ncbi:MAG TPA: GGDEF domain-containing protein, partial [Vicinamibacterales bacterium]|nr:GGDEF domain-containing protein [Vicinamibacterales bacterium]
YEFISRFTQHLCYRMFLSLLVIVAFDTVLFTMLVSWTKPNLLWLMWTGFLAKASACAFYSTVSWAYMRYVEPASLTTGSGDVADVFQTLTYRQKYEAARERMVRDALTGLYNRGYYDEVFPQMLAHAERHHEPLSLVVIDTDNFKSINDQFSHPEGDVALRLIASTLQLHARASDVPCRIGGDEFVVLISGGNADAARTFAERFRTTLHERCQTADPPHPWGYVTTTIGIATYPDDGATMQELMRVADARLYVGKRGGRDAVIASPALAPAGLASASTQRADRR